MLGKLLYVILVAVLGCYFFGTGFLVTKTATGQVNNCGYLNQSGCDKDDFVAKPKFKRALVVIIDAMRYDFIAPDIKFGAFGAFNLGRFKVARDLTEKYPDNSLIYVFRADPPTTTLQRLKALMSGTLPSFIDAGANFGSSHIAEDNLVDIVVNRLNQTAVCIGDDVWSGVFPTQFGEHAHLFPGLNVWDLHSVDDSILPVLENYMRDQDSWKLLIAHFVGLDHSGHRFGPEHPATVSKIRQMSEIVRNLTEQMDDDTLLVVFGDHGMDPSGNHGGDSGLETFAALWLYSKTIPITSRKSALLKDIQFHATDYEDWQKNVANAFPLVERPSVLRAVNQIDLVPTIALMLGLPIPFENLGSAIVEPLFSENNANWAVGLLANANQIMLYLNVYYKTQALSQLSSTLLRDLKQMHTTAVARLTQFIANPANQTAGMEAFQSYLFFSRHALANCRKMWSQFDAPRMLVGIFCMCAALVELLHEHSPKLKASALASFPVLLALYTFSPSISDHFYLWELYSVTFLLLNLVFRRFYISLAQRGDAMAAVAIYAVHCLSMFSDSFTIHEQSIVHGLAQTLLLVKALHSQSGLSIFIAEMVISRIQHMVTYCRAEQRPFCVPTVFGFPGSSITGYPVLALQLAVYALAVYLLWLKIKPSAQTIAICAIGSTVGWLYWALDTIESHEVEGSKLTEFGTAISVMKRYFAFYAYPPLLALICYQMLLRKKSRANVLVGVYTALLLILKPMSAVSLSFGMIHIILLTFLDTSNLVFWTVYMFLYGYKLFFATGRQATLQSIDWSLAFLGFEHVNYFVSPILLVFSHFGVFLFSALAASFICSSSDSKVQQLLLALVLGNLICSSIATYHLNKHHSILNVFLPRWLLSLAGNFLMVLFSILLDSFTSEKPRIEAKTKSRSKSY